MHAAYDSRPGQRSRPLPTAKPTTAALNLRRCAQPLLLAQPPPLPVAPSAHPSTVASVPSLLDAPPPHRPWPPMLPSRPPSLPASFSHLSRLRLCLLRLHLRLRLRLLSRPRSAATAPVLAGSASATGLAASTLQPAISPSTASPPAPGAPPWLRLRHWPDCLCPAPGQPARPPSPHHRDRLASAWPQARHRIFF